MARSFGNRIRIGSGVGFKHLETFEIGDGVFIGDHAYIRGALMELPRSAITFGLGRRLTSTRAISFSKTTSAGGQEQGIRFCTHRTADR